MPTVNSGQREELLLRKPGFALETRLKVGRLLHHCSRSLQNEQKLEYAAIYKKINIIQ
jgi:hypothetical protein